ncbi:unnamed protein product [Orchesella dallaii]|uniref:EamA domain-containing protein n=1 Tax=Orchesella dallaii TaxID=48710 RepID=A0ABP1QII1_9HEXA
MELFGIKKYLGLFLAFSASFCFSVVVLFVKILKDYGFSAYGASFWRFTGTAVLTFPLLFYYDCGPRVKNKNNNKPQESEAQSVWPAFKKENWKTWVGLLSRGILGSSSVILRYYSLQYLTIGDTSVISYATPVLVTVLAHFFLGEKCGIFSILIAIITLCGVVIVTKPPILTGAEELDTNILIGSALAVGSLICTSFYTIVTRSIRAVHFTVLTLVVGIVGVIQSFALIYFVGEFNMPGELFDSLFVAGVGILSFLGQIFTVFALKFENAGPVSLVRSCDVIFGFLFQFVFLQVAPDIFSAVGAIIVLLGVLSTGFRKWINSLPEEDKRRARWGFVLKENLIIEKVEHKRVICYASNQDFRQELSLFPDLVWKIILGYVTDPNTISALLNTSPFFHQEMKVKETGLLQLILPHLMKNACLDFPNTLKCRLVSTTIKSTVDKTFKGIRNERKSRGCSRAYPSGAYSFETAGEINTFIQHFESIPILTGNPFVKDCLHLWVFSLYFYERTIQLLTRFGHLIKELEFIMDYMHHPATLMKRLIRTLNLVPNLELLRFRFTGFPEAIQIDVDEENEETRVIDLARAFPVPPATLFPRLARLHELEFIQLDRQSKDYPSRPTYNSMREATLVMLEAYGPQLSVLKCGSEMFTMEIPVDFLTQQMSNLSELIIAGFERDYVPNCLGTVSNIQLPKLKRLSLEIMDGHLQYSFLGLLNNLRNSLEELYLWTRKIDNSCWYILHLGGFQPPMMTLPKLKHIIIEPPELNLDMDSFPFLLIKSMLTNLECLEFRISNRPALEQLPEIRVQKYFFNSYPNLKQFIWKVTREDSVETTVITRMDSEHGGMRVPSGFHMLDRSHLASNMKLAQFTIMYLIKPA